MQTNESTWILLTWCNPGYLRSREEGFFGSTQCCKMFQKPKYWTWLVIHNINLRVFVITSFALRSCLTVFLFVLQAGLFRGSKDSDMDHWPEISWWSSMKSVSKNNMTFTDSKTAAWRGESHQIRRDWLPPRVKPLRKSEQPCIKEFQDWDIPRHI